MLSNEEKSSLIDNRIKNLEYNKYNLQLGLVEENAVANPNQDSLNSILEQISFIDARVAALQAEKATITE